MLHWDLWGISWSWTLAESLLRQRLAKNMDLVSMLCTEENKNTFSSSSWDHCFKHGCWDKDWQSLPGSLAVASFSYTDLSMHCQETEIFQDQNFNNTDNVTPVTQQSPDLSKWVPPEGETAVLGEQRTCTTCRANGEWTLPATKSSLIQTGVRKRLFKNCSREDTEIWHENPKEVKSRLGEEINQVHCI